MLFTFISVLLFCLVAAHWASETSFGKAMRRALIDAPARWLADATPLKLIVGTLALVAFAAIISGAPEFAATMGIGDLVFFGDMLVVGVAVAYTSVLLPFAKTLFQRAANLLTRFTVARTGRAVRVRRPRRLPSFDSDEPEPAWVLAFAS